MVKTLIYLWASWQQQLPWQFQINQIPPAFPSAVTVVGQEVSQAEGRAATASSPTAPAWGWLGLSCKATAWLLRSYGCSLVLALQHLRLLQSSTGSSPQHPPCPPTLPSTHRGWQMFCLAEETSLHLCEAALFPGLLSQLVYLRCPLSYHLVLNHRL